MRQSPQLFELSLPLAGGARRIRLQEPPGANHANLLDEVLSGTYTKPFIVENSVERALHFSLGSTQSSMRLDNPWALELRYTRKMMGFLLFLAQPRKLLMLGLGGGSLAKYCYLHLPLASIEVVELDPDVIALRNHFLIPADDGRFNVVAGDAAAYVEECPEKHDVIMMDACDRDGIAPSICTREFYANVHAGLHRGGILVANLVGRLEERLAHLGMIRAAFAGNLLFLPVEADGNDVVFAFRNPEFEPRWQWICSQAKAMSRRYGLDFPGFVSALERSRQLAHLRLDALQRKPS